MICHEILGAEVYANEIINGEKIILGFGVKEQEANSLIGTIGCIFGLLMARYSTFPSF